MGGAGDRGRSGRPLSAGAASVPRRSKSPSSPCSGSWHLPPLTLLQHCQETPLRPQSSLPFVSGSLPGFLLCHLSLGPLPSLQIQPVPKLWAIPGGLEIMETLWRLSTHQPYQLSCSARSTIHFTLQASLPILVPALPPCRRNGYGKQLDPQLPLHLGFGALTAYLSLQWPLACCFLQTISQLNQDSNSFLFLLPRAAQALCTPSSGWPS